MASEVNFGMKNIPSPLGFCVPCLQEGSWAPAAVMVEGASMCALCGIGRAGGPGQTVVDAADANQEQPLMLLHKVLRKSATPEEMYGGTFH